MTRDELLEIIEAVLEKAEVPDVIASLSESRDAAVRFGQNRITQNMDTFERKLRITLGDGSRKTVYSTHRIDIDAVPDILEEAMEMLTTASPDPEYMPPVPAGQVYPVVDAWDSTTAEADPKERTEAAARAISTAKNNGMEASGLVGMSYENTAIGTSTGNLAYHRSTDAYMRLTLDRGKPSSFRFLSAEAWEDLPVDSAIREVAAEVESDEDQRELEPGEYRLIFEPQAAADLIPYIAWSMNARPADEGLTVFSGRQDEMVAGSNFTMTSEVNGLLKGTPFDGEGLASGDAVWIDGGRLVNQPCTRFWAQKTDREPLFIPGTLALEGGSESIEDIISGTPGRALLFRRFWYIRFVDQKELSLTGMTRDGVFLVEDGKIVHPVADFRWNWKPLELFSRIEKLGTPQRKGQISVPPMIIGPTVL
ncbi:MAG: metallopeptidase TldD-related protein [Candidatus Fermentibacteria bacterium]